MAKQDETTIAMRIDRKFTEQIDEHAQKLGMNRSEMVRTLVAKGINEQPTYPLAKFLVFAPQKKALYVIMTPHQGGGAKVHTWNVAEDLYSELHNLDNLKELVANDADILYWEV
jgi:antitoxin component of RelBE/YafQ-DinJ toxin-antitoxin module